MPAPSDRDPDCEQISDANDRMTLVAAALVGLLVLALAGAWWRCLS